MKCISKRDGLGGVRKKNIKKNHSLCCGCVICTSVCPTKAISIGYTDYGFKESFVGETKCVSCGKCENVCPFINISYNRIENQEVFSYKDSRKDVLECSSSGGFAYALSEVAVENNYEVCGCAFDKMNQIAEHIIVKNQAELSKLQGSKYMQSDLTKVAHSLIGNQKIVVFGTPCQIAAARKLHGDGAVYVDLICHGVPSYHLYKKYQDFLSRRFNMETKNMEIVFRHKPSGWREIYIYTADSGHRHICHQSKDPYFLSFEYGLCYGRQCHECPWRNASAADIRIGDFWGPKFEADKTGVNMVVSMTETGQQWLNYLQGSGKGALDKADISDYFNYQQTVNFPEPPDRKSFLNRLKDDDTKLEDIVKAYITPLEKKAGRFLNPVLVCGKRILEKVIVR